MTLNANAILTLNEAKTYLKLPLVNTSQDDVIELWINAAADFFETECDRILKKKTGIVEYHGSKASQSIVLRQFPVIAVTEIRVDPTAAFTDPGTIVDPSSYAWDEEGEVTYLTGRCFPSGKKSVKVTYDAGYDPVPYDLKEAANWYVYWRSKIRDAGDIGRSTRSKEGESTSYSQSVPQDIMDTLLRYKRLDIKA